MFENDEWMEDGWMDEWIDRWSHYWYGLMEELMVMAGMEDWMTGVDVWVVK